MTLTQFVLQGYWHLTVIILLLLGLCLLAGILAALLRPAARPKHRSPWPPPRRS